MNKVWYACAENFQKWLKNPRIYILFLLFFLHMFDLMLPFNKTASTLGVKNTPWTFPFVSSSLVFGMFLLLGYVLLFCDAPFTDRHQPYIIIRIGKIKWMWGQILYIVLSSLIFVLSIQIFIIIVLLPTLTFSTDWGKMLYTVSQLPIEGFVSNVAVSYSLITSYSPIQATVISMLLVWLEGIFIGCLIFVFNMKFKKMVGTILGCFHATLFFMVKGMDSNTVLWKIVPSAWMDLATESKKLMGRHPGIVYAVVGLLVLIVVLWGCMIRMAKRYSVDVVEQI